MKAYRESVLQVWSWAARRTSFAHLLPICTLQIILRRTASRRGFVSLSSYLSQCTDYRHNNSEAEACKQRKLGCKIRALVSRAIVERKERARERQNERGGREGREGERASGRGHTRTDA
eukprot:6206261-Pleurochrysis_carterae.AAC.3